MPDLTQIREQYEAWASFVRSLKSTPESDQNTPISEGKWAVRDVIAHIWKWDEHFWEHAVRPLIEGLPLTYCEMDYDAFNENAKNECRKLGWSSVLDEAAKTREKIANAIRNVSESEYARTSPDADGHPFSIQGFLEDFVHHDSHHRHQIEVVLHRN